MESIQYARMPGEVVVVRVCGKGSHKNSLALRKVLELTSDGERYPQYVFDLEKCTSMDSTFMGMLASAGLRQLRSRGTRTVLANTNDHVHELLDLLGLKYVIDIRPASSDRKAEPAEDQVEFTQVPVPDADKLDRIIMMIEAHETLVDVESQNEVKFKGVLNTLRESLEQNRPE